MCSKVSTTTFLTQKFFSWAPLLPSPLKFSSLVSVPLSNFWVDLMLCLEIYRFVFLVMISVSCLCLLITNFSSLNYHLQLNDTLTQCQAPTLGPGSRFPLVWKRASSCSTLLSLPNLVLYLPAFCYLCPALQEPVLTSPLSPSLP